MPESIFYPTFPIYFLSKSEKDLAAYQNVQIGNTCTFHAITTALRLLIDFHLDPQELSDEVDHLWRRFRPMRTFPGWAVTPHQQKKVVEYLKDKYSLPINVEFSHASPNSLFDNLILPTSASIVTLLWGYNRAPAIYYGNSTHNYNSDKSPAGHTMLLAAFDSSHTLSDGTTAPWGMINSWVDNGNYLFWMKDDQFQRSWNFFLPFIGPNPLVTLSVV
jgi:hypothetical protein